MEPIVLDKSMRTVAILDSFESLLWIERFSSCGDFEIYTVATEEMVSILQIDYYLWLRDSDQVMIIESVQITSDVENGNHLLISGRSLESILDRRIVWVQTVLDGYLQGQVKKLLEQNVISPSIASRKIPNFIFEESTDSAITSLKISAQFTGDNLYDVIVSICESSGIGFRIRLDESNRFAFSLYSGVDRSYDQTKNPFVIFSPNFDNIIGSNFLKSNQSLKTVTLVAGEDEGKSRRTLEVPSEKGSGSGLERRELYTDARDISSTVDDKTLTETEYNAQLKQRGLEKLVEYVYVESFEGEVDPERLFIYGKDYFKGDIVQVANEYGIEARSRISELIRSQSSDGLLIYPTFVMVE